MQTTISKYIAITCLLTIPFLSAAQQDLLFTQYRFNAMAINPAYAGNHNALSVTGLVRKQWIGMEGSPGIFAGTAHTPMANNKVGMGLSLYQEKVGVTRKSHLSMAYSYKIIKGDNRLSFGLQGTIVNYSQLLNQLENINAQDPNFTNNIQRTMFNFGAGIFYETRSYFLSFSIPQLIKNLYEPGNPSSGRQVRQYFLSGGYLFNLNQMLKLKATGLVRYDEDFPTRFDINSYLLFKEKIWIGLSYKYKDAVSALLDLSVTEKLRVGLAYDYLTNDFQKVTQGSMEIMINYRFVKDKKQKMIFF